MEMLVASATVGALIVLIIGLFRPAKVLPAASNPTRIKVVGVYVPIMAVGLALGAGATVDNIGLPVPQPPPPASPAWLTVGFVGDSITGGYGASHGSSRGNFKDSPTDAVSVVWRLLPSLKGGETPAAAVSQYGVPATSARSWMDYYRKAKDGENGWNALKPDLFMVMFGANDANKGDSVAAYMDHLSVLVRRIERDFPKAKIVINAPLWIDQANASEHLGYRPGAAARVEQYVKALKAHPELIDNRTVFLGDTEAHDRFMEADIDNPSGSPIMLDDGVHPNDAGHTILGHYWFEAIRNVLTECDCAPRR